MPIHYAKEGPDPMFRPKEEMEKIYNSKLNLPKFLTKPNDKEYYIVDFSKVKTTEEILLIIASMGVVLSADNPLYPQLEHLLDKDNPIKESQLNK